MDGAAMGGDGPAVESDARAVRGGGAAGRVRGAMSPPSRSASPLIRRTSCPAWVISRPASVNSAKRSRFGRAVFRWAGRASDFIALSTLYVNQLRRYHAALAPKRPHGG